MGYEICFNYHPKLESGDYDRENTEELRVKVGEPFEDVTLEKLASTIMFQRARRDVWVVGVEIFEYKKQQVSFRESDGGIIIKNKKFRLDQTANLMMEDIQEAPPHNPVVAPHNQMVSQPPVQQAVPNGVPIANPNRRPIHEVMLDPDIPNMHKVKQAGLAFTEGKKYPVFSIKPHPKRIGVNVFVMWDDNNREVTVTDEYFLPANSNLKFGEIFKEDGHDAGPSLAYQGIIDDVIPDIRR